MGACLLLAHTPLNLRCLDVKMSETPRDILTVQAEEILVIENCTCVVRTFSVS